MRKQYSPGEKRKIIINFIKKNSTTNSLEIKNKTKLHIEREFENGIKEAFEEAGVKPPRTFKRKTREQKREIIINYIQKHPDVGGQIISKNTKINPSSVFSSIKEAYDLACVKYTREENTKLKKRPKSEREREIIKLIRKNPLISITEIIQKIKIQPYRIFKNMEEMYKKAGISFLRGHDKRKIKKQREIIEFIKKNPVATQREINNDCKTHVQQLFNKGIFEAYQKAGIKFPFERLKLYGIGLEEIRNRAKTFEEEMAIQLSGYGKVNRLVKTKRGFADIIFERKGKKIVIEIKDYQNKDISISQIKQVNKYIDDCGCNLGFLICHKKPRKDKFLMGENKIFVLDKEELDKIPELMDGCVV